MFGIFVFFFFNRCCIIIIIFSSASNMYWFLFSVCIFRWRGSVYKLVWRELLAYLALYYTINIMYRYALTDDQKRYVYRWTCNVQESVCVQIVRCSWTTRGVRYGFANNNNNNKNDLFLAIFAITRFKVAVGDRSRSTCFDLLVYYIVSASSLRSHCISIGIL